ncbi:hypothetical protein H0E84_04680 [Luteimonas sp. SJ-92]|uniref:Uncharacterized protein n=1 Tax=Luteimonas salinisoli TaxID=2752307 RepID=A0A853JAH4_9GAMM|nr:hypothetical protein [Luteimonas salinisoli]NZA25669.1 hypothetical protein [Luteimonas salinisoli]
MRTLLICVAALAMSSPCLAAPPAPSGPEAVVRADADAIVYVARLPQGPGR